MKQRLLIITSTFPRWFNDTDPPFVYELAKRLAPFYDVTVHTPHYAGAETKEVMEGIQVRRFRYCLEQFEKLAGGTGILPTLRNNKLYFLVLPCFLIAQLCSLLLEVQKERPDVIHAHWVIPHGFYAAILKKIFKIPVLLTAHGGDIYSLQVTLLRKAKCFALEKADCVTVVSSSLSERVQLEVPSVQTQIIPMGVSTKRFRPRPKNNNITRKYSLDNYSILYVGRLSEKKGVQYLIEAMPHVLKAFPNAHLLIVGSGELKNQLEEIVQEMELHEHILFAGGVPNDKLPAYYAGAKIFVGPSIKTRGGDTEGFGLTFVEAALSGCLLIGSDVGGIKDIIEDKRTGYLVPEKNSQAIAERIIYAFKNEKEANEIIIKARKKCLEQFDWDVIAEKYNKLLSSI